MRNISKTIKNQDLIEWRGIFQLSLKIIGIGFIAGLILIIILSRGLPSVEQLEDFDPDLWFISPVHLNAPGHQILF